ncbi:hypothetical protein TWF694_004390 [Orbilia ellipsospora]|uniref:O-methyltransferase C-terminal domain-containing protein n=1 Tax=Orbilia ellipsospora TaxID=2528407 RepID=A0AAV9WUZ9_9PEZI
MAVLRPSLSELATRIATNTKIVEDYIKSQGLPYPSFAADGSERFPLPPPSTPELEKIHTARQEVLAATKLLYDLTAGPYELIQNLFWSLADTSTLHVIHHFKIAQIVPEKGDISYTELSRQANISPIKLRQVLRYAMTNHVFYEPRHGYIAHTAVSMLLRDEKSTMWALVGFYTQEACRTNGTLTECLEKFPHSEDVNEGPWSLAFDGKGFFQYFNAYPESAKRFGVAMSSYSSGDGMRVASLVTGYDWGKLPEGATVVDVGGATGYVSVEIAKANPSLKFIVEDASPLSLEEGKKNLARDNSDLTKRFEYQLHDFLTEQQPVKGADAYLFRFILHNWPDKYIKQILKNLVPGLKNGAKIILNDVVLLPVNSLSAWEERRVRALDMFVLNIYNSFEREEAEWRKLFAEVEPRLRLDTITQPSGSLLSIIQATYVDE